MKKYLPFVLMFLGCITWGRGNHSDFLYYSSSILLLLIVVFHYASSKNSSFAKELRILAIILLVVFAFKGAQAVLTQAMHLGKMSFGIFVSAVFRFTGSLMLLLDSKTFIKEYSASLKNKVSNPNS